ncbi:MAG: transcriptional regulator [Pseudomonadota bacterium]
MPTDGLDTLIHAPNRLAICAFLAPLDDAEFQLLREALDVSDSVLSKHVARLQEAGYLAIEKRRGMGRPRTWLSLTRRGRAAYTRHVAALRALIDAATPA